MMIRRFALFLALLVMLALPRSTSAVDSIPADQFDRLGALIKPSAAESSWSSIPWLVDINEAREKAATEGKPLFVWTAAGEPLGSC